MKFIYKAAITILTATLLLTGCSSTTDLKEGIDFQKITIKNNNCTATEYIYEAEVDKNGVWLRAGTINMSDEESSIDYYREYHAVKEVKQQIAQKLQECKATSWDGFSESNPDIMDGSSFSLNISLADDSAIKAYGSNTSPKNYGDFESFFTDLILVEEISESRFEGFNLDLNLPESWVGNTTVHYDDGGLTFYLGDKESEDYILFVDINQSGYSDYYKNIIQAGRLTKEEDEYYITLRANTSIFTQNKEFSKDQTKILDELQEDMQSIAQSIKGINEYTFIPNN